MRVAVVEPFFRTSGVTTYATHLAEGLRLAGCDADLVTFTLSGKASSSLSVSARRDDGSVRSGWQWSTYKPDRIASWDDAAEVLAEYDLVFVNEPRCAPLDKRSMRRLGKGDIKRGRQMVADHDLEYPDLPPYIRALSESGVPWVTCMHDPGYGPKLAPFLPQLLEVAPPSLVVTHRAGAWESGLWAEPSAATKLLETPWLPYASRPHLKSNTDQRIIGATGRYINNKGQPTIVGLAAYNMLPKGWQVSIAGASPLGAGPNHTFLTYEALLKHGFVGAREGNGNVTTGDPWRVYPACTQLWCAEYTGPYEDGIEASCKHGIHVSATDAKFSGEGSLEYADLEAIDAGCLLVLPLHRDVRQDYAASRYTLLKCLNAELAPLDPEREATLQSLSEAIRSEAALWGTPQRAVDQERNVSLVQSLNSPKSYAEKILGAVGK